MTSQDAKTQDENVEVQVGLANLTAGGVLLPRFINRAARGLCVDLSLLDSAASFRQFVDRVFTADAYFADLNFPLLFKLLYPSDDKALQEKMSREELRLARDIVPFAPERRGLYHKVKISSKGNSAEYYFEPVSLDEEVEEPVFGPPEEDGSIPILSYEKRPRPVKTRLDQDEFIAAMWNKGVRFGIDMDAVHEAIVREGTERLEIARGQESVAGIDAGIVEESDTLHRDNSPRELSNGRIDLRQFKNHFPQVSADTRLLKKSPRTMGALGWDVRGTPIEPKMPKDFDIETLAGPGTRIDRTADGEFIVAAITGFVNLDIRSNSISVNEKIVNRHGISLRTTGDLSLSGADFEEHGEVQERRVVKGHNMTFLADVFGQVLSDGGIINLKDGLAGGSAHSPNGSIVISGTASRAVIEARGGEITIAAAENCIVVATKVRMVRAVNCDILAEEVSVDSCEGCAVAGKEVQIGEVGSRKGTESVVTLLLPDNSAWNRDIAALAKKVEEAGVARGKKEQMVALLSEKPEVKKFLDLLQKVEAKEITMSAEQEIGWQAAQARFASVKRQYLQLDGEIRELSERERLYGGQAEALAAAKAEASARPSCKLRAVKGETVVRTMTVHHGVFPLGNVTPKEIHKQLRAHGSAEDKLFSGHGGTFSWPEKDV